MSARNYAKYPAYRDSGVEWLGEIPQHWETAKLWQISQARSGGTPTRDVQSYWNGDVPWVSPKDMKRRVIDSSEEMITAHALADTALRLHQPGVVLIVVRGMILAHSFPVAITGVPVTINQDMKALTFTPAVDPQFAVRFFEGLGTTVLASIVTEAGHGTKTVRMDAWRLVLVAIPPIAEQEAIVAYVDRETARIDALVAKKERLIALLQERRIALITRAVTKGLDPSVPMKDSGVEWLGEIPAHWEVAPVYARYQVQLGKMLDSAKQTNLKAMPYVRNVDVQWDSINTENLPEMDIDPSERERYRIRKGDILVCEGGEVGRSAIWNYELQECYYQKALHRVRPIGLQEIPRFFYWLMMMVARRGVFSGSANQNTIDHLTATQLRHYRFPFASVDEQRAIARYLDRETSRIDNLIVKIRTANTRLRELRTALISAAVTGKIDVREAVA